MTSGANRRGGAGATLALAAQLAGALLLGRHTLAGSCQYFADGADLLVDCADHQEARCPDGMVAVVARGGSHGRTFLLCRVVTPLPTPARPHPRRAPAGEQGTVDRS